MNQSIQDRNNRFSFRAGSVFNPLRHRADSVRLIYRAIEIQYPSRLNAMAIDPGRIAPRKDFKYSAGEVLFSIGLFKKVKLRLRSDKEIVTSKNSPRPSLIKHAALLMRHALRFREGFTIHVENDYEIPHCGLGSSSGLIASVAATFNELYGNPISSQDLIRYLAQNHGEEIEGDTDRLNHVQCIGGSAAAGLCSAGMIVLTGEAVPVATMKISDDYCAVIGIPKDFRQEDSVVLMTRERKAMKRFIKTGISHGPQNAYNILHTMLPAMAEGDLGRIGDVIYEYRYTMGSIRNCSFAYPKLPLICNALASLKQQGIAEVLSVSSVGPGVFAITKNPAACIKAFKKEDLKVYKVPLCNDGYTILKRTPR